MPGRFTARQAYIAAVAARSTITARLRHTTALAERAELHPWHTRGDHTAHTDLDQLALDDAS